MGSIPFLLSFQLSVNNASPIQLLSTMFSTILSRTDRLLLRRLDAFLLKNLQLQKPSLTRCCLLTRCANHQVTGHASHFICYQSRTVTGAPVVTMELSMKLLEFPQPVDKKKLREFLGMVNFYHRFILHCAGRLHPLHKLLSSTDFIWSPECEEAFQF
jgi:hypothetical protein